MDNTVFEEENSINAVTKDATDDSTNARLYSENLYKSQSATFSKHASSFSQHQQNTLFNEKYKNCLTNFSEKIVFILDTVNEKTTTQFKLSSETKYGSLYMIKRVVEIFLHNKSVLNSKHAFALIILDSQKAHWICNFTENVKTLLNKLESIDESSVNDDQKYFELQDAFKLVHHYTINESFLLKNNIVRIILIYCRSNVLPRFHIAGDTIQELISNSNFFLDVLYLHESPSLENKCREIYAELNKLDVKDVSYIMETAHSAVKVHNCMAKLLAHPLQRLPQKDMILYSAINSEFN